MKTPIESAFAKAAHILQGPREKQEKFLRTLGWMRLVDRADVWFNPSRPESYAHDVYLLPGAILEAAREEAGIRPKPRIHHHAGAPL